MSPAAHRSALKKLKAGKYVARVQAKAAYEANRPTEPTYKVDPTDSVFDTSTYEQDDKEKTTAEIGIKANKFKTKKTKMSKLQNDKNNSVQNELSDSQVTVADLG